jgi:NitT/TauT family transport system substrate-binding protein
LIHVHAGVIASGKMIKESPNTLKAVLRALAKATGTINTDREAAVKIVAREMKMDEALARDIMALNVYSMEQTDKHVKGMAEFIDFLHSLDRIKQKFPPDGVFVTRLLEDIDPKLVKWKSKTEVR